MPLIKGKSQKAFETNLKTEMEHGHPQKQALAIAYSMKRKAGHKKMADGGSTTPTTINPDAATSVQNSFRHATHYAKGGEPGSHAANHAYNYDAQKDMKGVHEVLPRYKEGKMTYGESTVNPEWKGLGEGAKKKHHEVLNELRTMPNPKLKGLADGGHVCSQCGYAEGGVVPGETHAAATGREIEHEEHLEPVDSDLGQYHETPNHEATEEDDMVSRIMAKRYSEGGKVANDTHEFEHDFETPNKFDDLELRDDLDFDYDAANSGDELGNEQEDHDRSDIVDRIMRSRRKKDKLPSPA